MVMRKNVIRMYAFLKCNELRNHHTQLTMQAQSVSMYTISNATMYCDRLLWLSHLSFFVCLRNVLLLTCNRRRRGGLVAPKTENDPNTWTLYSWKDHDLLSHQPHTILPYTFSFHTIFSEKTWNNSLCEKAHDVMWNITDLTFFGRYLKVAGTMVSLTVTRPLCQS